MSLADLRFMQRSENDGIRGVRLSDGLPLEDMPSKEPMRPRGVWRRNGYRSGGNYDALHKALRSRIGEDSDEVKTELDSKVSRRGRLILQEIFDQLPRAAYEIDGRVVVHFNHRAQWLDEVFCYWSPLYIDLEGLLQLLPARKKQAELPPVKFERNGKTYVCRDGIWYRSISTTKRWRQIVGFDPATRETKLEDRESVEVTFRQLDRRRLRKLGIFNAV